MKKFLFTLTLLLSLNIAFGQQVEGITVEQLFERFDEIKAEKDNDTLYVFNFWATWCVPCVEELPYFQQLYANYKDQKVKLVLVSLDFDKDLSKKVIPFVEKQDIKADVWVLTNYMRNMEWIDKLSPEWGGSIPATLIYQPQNKVYAFKEATFEYEELEEWVLSFQ
jgi:thiol-disulfide isomerase/thioredoxin